MKKRTRGRAATCVCKDISVSLFIYSSDALLTLQQALTAEAQRTQRKNKNKEKKTGIEAAQLFIDLHRQLLLQRLMGQ